MQQGLYDQLVEVEVESMLQLYDALSTILVAVAGIRKSSIWWRGSEELIAGRLKIILLFFFSLDHMVFMHLRSWWSPQQWIPGA
jgi:hypothetical protein